MKNANICPRLVRAALVACFSALVALFCFGPVSAQDTAIEPVTPLLPAWSSLNRPDWQPSTEVIAAAREEAEPASTLDAEAESNPAWVRTAFISYRDGNAEVYSADSNGNNQVRLTVSDGAEARPRVSIDGKWVAYDVDVYGLGGREIFRVPFGGGSPEVIVDTPGAGVRDMAPAWSPDGKYLAFVSTRDGNAEIYLLILATMQLWRVTYNGLADYDPSWNAATGELVWARQMDSVYGVTMAAPVGGSEHRVSEYIVNLETPMFDLTGEMLAYTAASQPGGPSQVYIRHKGGTDWVTMPDALPDNMMMFFRLGGFYTHHVLDNDFSPGWIRPIPHTFITRYLLGHDGRAWRLLDADLLSQGFNAGEAFSMDGDAVVLDQIAPTLVLPVPPGQGPSIQATLPISYTDKGGSGIVAVEANYTSDKGAFPYPEFVVPPARSIYLQYVCGNTTLNAQVTDGAGHRSPWQSVSTVLVGSTRTITMQEIGGAPVQGAEISSSEGGFNHEEIAAFGRQISDVAGLIHYRTCGDNGYWFWPDSPKWERFDTSAYYGSDGLVLLSKKGQVPLTKEYPLPSAASTDGSERILVYRATGDVDPAKVSDNLWLALWYGTGYTAQSPMRIELQTSAALTPTVLVEKKPLAGQVEYLYLPMDSGLSGPFTITVSIEAREGVDGSNIWVGDARVASQWFPLVQQVSDEGPTMEFALSPTRTFTITGSNFMQPLLVTLGGVEASDVDTIDAQTLRATFPSALPAGMLPLVVTNRAATADAASTQLSNAVASQVRAWLPMMQVRATPLR